MSEITKQDFEKLLQTVATGFQDAQDHSDRRFSEIDSRIDRLERNDEFRKMNSDRQNIILDKIAQALDDMTVENSAGNISIRRVESRIDKVEARLAEIVS